MKKFTAVVRINRETHEIKEYEIQPKGEETSYLSVSLKTVIIILGISVAVHFALYFAFKILGL